MKQKLVSLNMKIGLWLSAAAMLIATASSPFSNQFRLTGNDALPFAPSGWDEALIITNLGTTGTHISDATLDPSNNVLVDIAIANNGNTAITETFDVCLYMDVSTLINCWTITQDIPASTGDPNTSYLIVVEDYPMTTLVGEGSHTLEMRIDAAGAITNESDKANNNFAADFMWVDPTPSAAAGALESDALTVAPSDMPADTVNSSYLPDLRDTSGYMIGKVAVSVILPESNDPASVENWSSVEIQQVKDKITAGLDNWETWYNAASSSAGNPPLDFVIEWHTNVLVPDDPIAFGLIDQDVWIDQALTSLGVPADPNYMKRVYAYDETLRTDVTPADWAFTIFVVDSSADSDGRFLPINTGSSAYSYLNGPFMVMTYDNANWGISRMNEVLAHQVAHIFGAADQYSGCTTGNFGYLAIANSNCGGTGPSLMLTGTGAPDITTQKQVGWLDSDADHIFNPADTIPLVDEFVDENDPLNPGGVAIPGTNHTFHGTYHDVPWTPAARPTTIRKITKVEYRIDSDAWQDADDSNGLWGKSDIVNFSFSLPSNLGGGNHTVYVRAQNGSGQPSAESSLPLIFSNDFFASAVLIPSIPFTSTGINTTGYHGGGNVPEPQDQDLLNCNKDNNLDRKAGDHSAWFRYTATKSEVITIDTIGSDFDTMIGLYLDQGSGNIGQIACDDDSAHVDLDSLVVAHVSSGLTYYISVSSYNGALFGSSYGKSDVNSLAGENDPGGNLVLNITSNGAASDFPTVLSSVRVDPNPTPLTTVRFTVTFSEPVTGVDESDFGLTLSGVSGATVSGVSGSDSVYTVSVATGSGSGTLRLDFVNNGSVTSISNGIPILSNYTGGETYDIDKLNPYILTSVRAGASPTSAASVNFTVTFSEPVSGVDVGDFNLSTSGSGVATAAVTGVSPVSTSAVYTVTVSTGTGNGTIRLNVVNNHTIFNGTSHVLANDLTNGELYRIKRTPIFDDVPFTYWANDFIERLYYAGVTGGCSLVPLNYCPDSTVTRAQMAVFLLKVIHSSSYTPPAVGSSTNFTDVPVGYWADKWIKQLSVEGITGGCGVGQYCPDATVTRAQMAVFLLKSKHGPSYVPPAATGVFTDVPLGYWADKWIERLAVEGVTSGCGAGIYCPDASVTRAQMAVFLVKAFSLP